MKIQFRQGIIRYQRDSNGNQMFLQKASGGSAINLLATNDPTIATIAQRKSNYLVEERVTVLNAWTGFVAGTDYWLYLDLDMVSGERTFGWTTFEPLFGTEEPTDPQVDQHWFNMDPSVYQQMVWNGVAFAPKLRVFFAKYQQGATIIPLAFGSQIGDTNTVDAGSILFDGEGQPIRRFYSRTHSEFFTTATIFTTNTAKSVNVTLDALCTTVVASEPIPAFYLIAHGETPGTIRLADTSTHGRQAVGLVQEDFYKGEGGIYTTQGYINNEQWNWTEAPGTQLFLGNNGEIVTDPSQYHTIQSVGEIVTPTMIRLDIGPSIRYDTVSTDYKNLVPVALDKTTGQYVATTVDTATEGESSKSGFLYIQEQAATVWTIVHNKQTMKCLTQVFDTTGNTIVPDNIRIVDGTTVEVRFAYAQAGYANVVFFNTEVVQVNYDVSLSAVSTFDSSETLLIQPMPLNAILPADADGCKAVAKTPDNTSLSILIDGQEVGQIVFTTASNIGTFVIPEDVTITEQQVLEVESSPTISLLANVGALIRFKNIGTL